MEASMSILAKLSKNAAGWASGVNWYRYGLYAVILASIVGASYFTGKHNCEIKHEQQKTAQAETKYIEVIKEVEKRVPVVQIREVESQKQKAAIASLSKRLQDATQNRRENPSCDLSDAEFDSLQGLIDKTNIK